MPTEKKVPAAKVPPAEKAKAARDSKRRQKRRRNNYKKKGADGTSQFPGGVFDSFHTLILSPHPFFSFSSLQPTSARGRQRHPVAKGIAIRPGNTDGTLYGTPVLRDSHRANIKHAAARLHAENFRLLLRHLGRPDVLLLLSNPNPVFLKQRLVQGTVTPKVKPNQSRTSLFKKMSLSLSLTRQF
jgi:hypothetical protein